MYVLLILLTLHLLVSSGDSALLLPSNLSALKILPSHWIISFIIIIINNESNTSSQCTEGLFHSPTKRESCLEASQLARTSEVMDLGGEPAAITSLNQHNPNHILNICFNTHR